MIKYIVFDFDGTLVDSKSVFISVFNQLARKYKLKTMEADNIDYLRQLSIKERCQYLGLPLYKLPFLSAEFLRLYKNSMKDVILIEGIKNLVDQLTQQGYTLAIISSNSKENIQHFLQANQIHTINLIYSSPNIFGKDRVIKKFLKTYRLNPEEVVYVGDEGRDIVACKKNNIKVIWVNWGYDIIEVASKEKPDFIANSPIEVAEIVNSLQPTNGILESN
ncbi:HAD-IA family hydrolase [Adhaeribacter radiodurans]|uniref:HAD-IA family hydrolase n=1 Tax=Adhaeribacter radiodurans TaxID=2745197 RepID=A0A7L7LES9_9BACT|nr:HAD-IA family hydrolase [Adhaeribacter radiodurans]QMU31372.1 HAD-IA family hydrolase [Adhaeribacter radiodurans]